MGYLFSLEGRVALITGASRGIGEAIALAMADHGALCILVSRKIQTLEKVVERIRSRGKSAEAMVCNIGSLSQVEELAEKIKKSSAGWISW